MFNTVDTIEFTIISVAKKKLFQIYVNIPNHILNAFFFSVEVQICILTSTSKWFKRVFFLLAGEPNKLYGVSKGERVSNFKTSYFNLFSTCHQWSTIWFMTFKWVYQSVEFTAAQTISIYISRICKLCVILNDSWWKHWKHFFILIDWNVRKYNSNQLMMKCILDSINLEQSNWI